MYLLQKNIRSRGLWKDIKEYETQKEAEKEAIKRSKSNATEKEGGDSFLFIGSAGLDYYEFRIIKLK